MDQATTDAAAVNGAGVPLAKITGRPKGARNLRAKHPSSLARRLAAHGVDWTGELALAVKAAKDPALTRQARALARDDVRMWMRALPYMVTTTNKIKVRKWRGGASKASLAALDALEGR